VWSVIGGCKGRGGEGRGRGREEVGVSSGWVK